MAWVRAALANGWVGMALCLRGRQEQFSIHTFTGLYPRNKKGVKGEETCGKGAGVGRI